MSLFKPGPPPEPRPRKGPPPAKPKPPPRVAQPEWDPAPALKRVRVGEICYVKVRVLKGAMEPMDTSMCETGAVWVEILTGDDPSVPGRFNVMLESAIITREKIVAEVRAATERGAA